MTTFYVGQRVRIVRATLNPHLLGTEARIVGPYRKGKNSTLPAWSGWPLDVRGSSGKRIVATEDCIEPILYDGNKTVEWSECLWQPSHQGAPA